MRAFITDLPKTDPIVLSRPLFLLRRVAFFVFIVPTLIFNIVTLPQSYAVFYGVLSGSIYEPVLLPASFGHAGVNPADYGLSLEFFATFYMTFNAVLTIGAMLVGIYIFVRRSNEMMTGLVGGALGTLGATFSPVLILLMREPFGEVLLRVYVMMLSAMLILIMLIFPTGHFVPRRGRWLVPVLILLNIVVIFDLGIDLSIAIPLTMLFALFGVYGQVRRYFHVSTPAQRQQTKWAMLGLMTFAVFMVGILVLKPICMRLGGSYFMVYQLIGFPFLMYGGFLALTVGLSFSVLRHNLWHVDFMMNRSILYLTLTPALIAVFFVIILLLQGVLERVLGGQQTTIVTVIATAVVVWAFNLTRNRMQRQIDRRVFGLRADLNQIEAAQKPVEIKNPGLYTGRTFGGYELLGVLGKGGMGEVYKGLAQGKTVAVKILPQNLAENEELLKRFIREGEMLASLSHHNIVKMFDAGVSDDGVHYLVMENIDGDELAVIMRGSEYNFEDVNRWVKGVAAALDYIHSKGLVHRDLKPSNIMLRTAGGHHPKEPVLMDFGIAHLDGATSRLTGSGAIGTIDYMAPEQMMAARDIDKRADVYALGVIVYEMLTNDRLFKGSAGQVLFAHLQQPAPDPRTVRPDVPRPMAKAVLQALEKKPEARYATAGEFAAALTTDAAVIP